MAEIKDLLNEANATELTNTNNRNKAEILISQVFGDWNNIKRCKTLADSVNYEQDKMKYELELHRAILSCELRLRSLQRTIRELDNNN